MEVQFNFWNSNLIKITIKFHTKKNTKNSFRQTIRKDKPLVMGKYLHLRKYGKIRYRTSKKYTNTLNSTNIKINNVTINQENGKYYASINNR